MFIPLSSGSRVQLKDGRVGTIDELYFPNVYLPCGCCSDFDYDNPHAAEVHIDGTPAEDTVEVDFDDLKPEE